MKRRTIGLSLSYLNMALGMVFGLFLSSYLIQMLGDAEYGVYQTVTAFTNYLVLLEFGTGTVITRNIARCRAENRGKDIEKNISTVLTITIGLIVLILIASMAFYALFDGIYAKSMTAQQIVTGKRVLLLTVAYLVFSFAEQTIGGIILGFEQYAVRPLLSVIRLICRTALLASLIFFFRYAEIIALIDACISLAALVFEIAYCARRLQIRFRFGSFDKQVLLFSLPLCVALFIQTLVNQANNNVDKFVIGVICNPESVTVYSVGLFFFNMFSSLTAAPISMYGPQVVFDVSKGLSGEQIADRLCAPSRMIVLLGGTVLFGFAAAGRQFIELIYGPRFEQSWLIAIIIMTPMLINMSSGLLINILDACNKRMSRSWVLLATTVGNIFLTVIWIRKYGMIGAAAATAICTLVGQDIVMNIYYHRVFGIRIFRMYFSFFRGILPSQIIAGVAGYFVGKAIRGILASFLASGCVYVAVFCILYYLWGMNDKEREQLQKVAKIVRKR